MTDASYGRVVLGSDHRGVDLRQGLAEGCRALGLEVLDLGPTRAEGRVDYPDLAAAVTSHVVAQPGTLGVLICGTGLGMSIAANKVGGVRAALVNEPYSAALARRHNDANVLCFGAGVLGSDLALGCLQAFLAAAFEGGRHAARIAKVQRLAPGRALDMEGDA